MKAKVIQWWVFQNKGEEFRVAIQQNLAWDWERPINAMWEKVTPQLWKCEDIVLGRTRVGADGLLGSHSRGM